MFPERGQKKVPTAAAATTTTPAAATTTAAAAAHIARIEASLQGIGTGQSQRASGQMAGTGVLHSDKVFE